MTQNSILDDFKSAWSKQNNAVVQIILINVIAFVVIRVLKVFFDISGNTSAFNFIFSKFQLPADPGTFLTQPWSLVTYFFLHFGFFHILFNMLFLFWFGRIIQDFLNSKRVVAMYVLGGLAGGLLYILVYNLVPFYSDRVAGSLMLGASAGVFAIVVGAAVFMPNYTFFLLFLGPVKIKYIAIFYVFMSFIQATGSNAGGEIAHLGGALIGWLFISQLRKGNDLGIGVLNTINWFKSFFVSQPKIKVTHRKTGQSRRRNNQRKAQPAKTDQDEIDAILDKISQSGYESLSKEEKQKLFDASKK